MARRMKPLNTGNFFLPLDKLPRSVSNDEYEETYWKCYHEMKEHEARIEGRVQATIVCCLIVLVVVSLYSSVMP